MIGRISRAWEIGYRLGRQRRSLIEAAGTEPGRWVVLGYDYGLRQTARLEQLEIFPTHGGAVRQRDTDDPVAIPVAPGMRDLGSSISSRAKPKEGGGLMMASAAPATSRAAEESR